MIRELLATLWDTVMYGDLRGHLRSFLQVVSGCVTSETAVRLSHYAICPECGALVDLNGEAERMAGAIAEFSEGGLQ
jgi:hypothetical protein